MPICEFGPFRTCPTDKSGLGSTRERRRHSHNPRGIACAFPIAILTAMASLLLFSFRASALDTM